MESVHKYGELKITIKTYEPTKKGRFLFYMNKLPKVSLKEIFKAVDESNQRFEAYSKEERRNFRETVRENARKIWDIVPESD